VTDNAQEPVDPEIGTPHFNQCSNETACF
jgi:hypothetical protein